MVFRADSSVLSDRLEPNSDSQFNPDFHSEIVENSVQTYATKTADASIDSLDFSVPIAGYLDTVLLNPDLPTDFVAPKFTPELLNPNLPSEFVLPELTPEQRLQNILSNVPAENTPEFLDEMFRIPSLLGAQLRIAEKTYAAVENFPGLSELKSQTTLVLQTALGSLSPELRQDKMFRVNLTSLPNYILAGQTSKANEIMNSLLAAAGPQSKGPLQAYFDAVTKLADENPDFVKRLMPKFLVYDQELATFDRMNEAVKSSPFHKD